jgi:MFS family permease
MSATDTPAGPYANARKVAAATFIGTTIEWYDFFIYGAAAALVFGPQFFPTFSPVAGVLAAFGAFAAGFVARPLGGLLFGHFGDRLGRKRTLVASLLLMGLGTFAIALLPTYEQIGVAAPLLLVALRVMQGLGVGGEWGGAVLMAIEHAPASRRAFYSSFPQMGIPSGTILSNLVFLVVGVLLSPQQFAAWGWRVPFLLSALLVVIALVIRVRLEESPEFQAAKGRGDVRRLPALDVLRTSPIAVLCGMGVSLAPSAVGYLFSVYLLSYGTTEIGLSRQTMLLLITGLLPGLHLRIGAHRPADEPGCGLPRRDLADRHRGVRMLPAVRHRRGPGRTGGDADPGRPAGAHGRSAGDHPLERVPHQPALHRLVAELPARFGARRRAHPAVGDRDLRRDRVLAGGGRLHRRARDRVRGQRRRAVEDDPSRGARTAGSARSALRTPPPLTTHGARRPHSRRGRRRSRYSAPWVRPRTHKDRYGARLVRESDGSSSIAAGPGRG